jgi:hypothetical protein
MARGGRTWGGRLKNASEEKWCRKRNVCEEEESGSRDESGLEFGLSRSFIGNSRIWV